MASNREIRRQFSLFSELLLLHGEDQRLSALLAGAAFRTRRITATISKLPKDELAKLFRPEIVKLIEEINKTGSMALLDELIQLTPSGLFDMMRIKGLGGKKLNVLWKTAKIDSLETLLEACKKNMLSSVPGFGEKTEQNIIKAIEEFHSNQQRFHYASVAREANQLVSNLQKLLKTKLLALCGEIRREATTVGAIEILAAVPAGKFKGAGLRKELIVQKSSAEQTSGHTLDEIPVIIYHTTEAAFFKQLFEKTGSEGHVQKVREKIRKEKLKKLTSEEAIYKAAGLPFIEPELREDNAEWEFVKKKKALVSLEDIRGVVHNHTTYSDGVDKLRDFTEACRDMKYEYCVISDHSKNAHYAGGLKEEKVLKQMKEIDELNKAMKPFRIFKSIECDIRVSGDLDYEDDFLANFDLVIISIHQLLKMDEEKATKRLLKAIENPYTSILGHMTGRQLLIRPGYPVDFKKVINACAANKVVIEINANPYRLDMDWSHIPYAIKKGVMISINPDAHSIGEIDNIRWGVSAARKGGLTKEMTWNAMGLKDVERWLKANKKT